MKWIVVANASDCKIYACDKKKKECHLKQEIRHDESRLRTQEMVSDKPGHFKDRSTYGDTNAQHQISIDTFAHELADFLDDARIHHEFDEFVLVTPAKMYGLLQKHMTKPVRFLLSQTIQKNMMNLTDNEMAGFVRKHLYH